MNPIYSRYKSGSYSDQRNSIKSIIDSCPKSIISNTLICPYVELIQLMYQYTQGMVFTPMMKVVN